jgi:serine/threonine protein kinase
VPTERTLLGPPRPEELKTLIDDQLRFDDGRLVRLDDIESRPTQSMGSVSSGSVGSTAPDGAGLMAPRPRPVAEEVTEREVRRSSAEEALNAPVVPLRTTRSLLEPGDHVEGYRIEREIGRGGMGRVYLALHTVTGQKVALKMLLPQLLGDARLKARFVNEAKVLAKVEHANLVQLLGFIDGPQAAFIVMPFVAGVTLDRIIHKEGQLSTTQAFDLFSQMCEGLAHMHRHGVMHRDLKPSNVLVQEDGRVRITDFGIARAVGSEKLTMDGMVVGTAEYLAPEQASGTDRDDTRSDQYAVAILLYEMLTGRVPFRNPSAAKVLLKQVSAPPPPPRTIRPELPVGVEQALLRALEKKPTDRFPDVLAFRDAVAAGLNGEVALPAPGRATLPPSAAPPRRLGSLALQILLGGAIGAGLAAAAWFMMR